MARENRTSKNKAQALALGASLVRCAAALVLCCAAALCFTACADSAGTGVGSAGEGSDSAWQGPELQKQELGTESISNARQLGGYPAADGRHVRDGALLRSGMLAEASPEDIEKLKSEYDLYAVIDLRTSEEAAENPDPAIENVAYYRFPLMEEGSAQNQDDTPQNQDDTPQNQAAIVDIYRQHGNDPGRVYVEMVRAGALSDDMYTSFLDSEEALWAWRQLFDVLLENEEGAVLWHCTGGKDRAGLTTAVVLSVLGVDKETILADFALTNEVLDEKITYLTSEAAKHTSDPQELEQVAALVGVSTDHMRMAFDYAEAESGSMAAFVQEKVGLTDEEVAQLRELYLV